MKRIKLQGAVLFTIRDGVNQTSSTMFEANREYIVEDAVAMHPVFADRLLLCEDVKSEPKPADKPAVKRPARRRKNGSHDPVVS